MTVKYSDYDFSKRDLLTIINAIILITCFLTIEHSAFVRNWGFDVGIAITGYLLVDISIVRWVFSKYFQREKEGPRKPIYTMVGFALFCFILESLQLVQSDATHFFGPVFRGTFDFPGDFLAYITGILIAEFMLRKTAYKAKS